MGYIYLITNIANGKRYVGQSQQLDIERRWSKHKNISKTGLGKHLRDAYIKYGIDKFKFQIICICFDEDCDKYEEEYIKKFNTILPNGYNVKCRGKSVVISDETRMLISKRTKETMTEKRRLRIIETHKGKTISEEHKKIISIKTKERWERLTEADRNKLFEKRKNSPNYINSVTELKKQSDATKKRVGKFDKNNTLLESFDSLSDASRTSNLSVTTISRVCSGKKYYKTAGGFVWKYI
jgi:group I intron endonuclease